MIFDTIKNKALYSGVSKDIGIALDYLAKTDFISMTVGRYEIDDNNIFVLVQEYDTVPIEQGKWERHEKYIDIQFVASGVEQIGFNHISNMKVKTEYNFEKDVAFLEGNGDYVTIPKNSFAIFFPEDAHEPKIAPENKIGPVKKVVVKIKVR